MVAGLGPDWVTVVAEHDRRRGTAEQPRVLVLPDEAEPGGPRRSVPDAIA